MSQALDVFIGGSLSPSYKLELEKGLNILEPTWRKFFLVVPELRHTWKIKGS